MRWMRRKHQREWDDFVARGYLRLADFNAERDRGLVHTDEYVAEMAIVQERLNAEQNVKDEVSEW